jgi:DASH complex subunit ASK1
LSTPGTARRHDDYAEGASPSPFSPGGSTPKARKTQKAPASIAKFSSPYEDLRRKVVPKDEEEDTPSSTMPSTPRGQTMSEAILDSSPFQAASVPHPSRSTRPNTAKDVLLHRILDKNYKLQATPILPIRLQPPHTQTRTPMTGRRTNAARQPIHNDDLDSSPLMEAPKLHTELFGSPARQRTPGVSVLTPAKNKTPRPAGTQPGTASAAAGIWDSDSDDDAFPEGMSPPKTMQFHIPQSKLLKTPGKHLQFFVVGFVPDSA